MNIKKARGLRYVRRFNFHNCNNYQNVAEHSYFVALIAREVAMKIRSNDGIFVIKCFIEAFFHDIEEAVLSDIPHLVKRKFDYNKLVSLAYKELEYYSYNISNDEDKELINNVVEFADCYELKLYLEEERRSGNKGLFTIEQETWNRLININIDVDVKNEFLDKLSTVPPLCLPDSLTHEGIYG